MSETGQWVMGSSPVAITHIPHLIISGSSFQQQSVQKSSFSSSSSGAAASTQVKSILKQPASVKHGEEIQQESLKTTIQSAITDIEQGMYHNHSNMA